jgi:hypothetical protein
MFQFLPKQAKQLKTSLGKRCDNCQAPHQNRKDNYCKACRPIVKARQVEEEQRVAEEEWRVAEEERRVAEEERRERDEELRCRVAKRQEEERERQARVCGCGGWKRPEFPRCWDCRVKYLGGLSETQKKVLLCACGKGKKPGFTHCYGCFQKKN